MIREHSDLLGGLFTGWGAGSFPLIWMYAPETYMWSGAAWGALLSIVTGLVLVGYFHEEGEQ